MNANGSVYGVAISDAVRCGSPPSVSQFAFGGVVAAGLCAAGTTVQTTEPVSATTIHVANLHFMA